MKFPRRRFLRLAAGAAALPVVVPARTWAGHDYATNAALIVERTQFSLTWFGGRDPQSTSKASPVRLRSASSQ